MKIVRLFAFLILLAPFVCSAQRGFYIYTVFDNYFPYSPMESTFSDFFKQLNSDPQLTDKSLHKRTDSSLFSFTSVYKNYNRGVLRSTDIEIKLSEIALPVNDSVNKEDTFIQYQVIYHYNNSNAGPKYVKRIFSDFNRAYNSQFTDAKDYEIKDNNISYGLIRNYFMFFSPISLMTVGWADLENNQSIFTIMIRLKLVQNELIVDIPPDKN
ncbi:MAG: hypothetical protein JST09_21930 [Bacteroidetes bacterium]|nr:hypothetical protein [Bacteroidota bacterium]